MKLHDDTASGTLRSRTAISFCGAGQDETGKFEAAGFSEVAGLQVEIVERVSLNASFWLDEQLRL